MPERSVIVRFGVFEVHLATGELRRNGARVKLQDQPFQMLAALLERPGEIVTKEELKERLWAGETFVDFDHSLATAVNKIREALGDSASSPRFIETVPRRGYRFVGGAQTVVPSGLELPNGRPGAGAEDSGDRKESRVRWFWALCAVALAAFGAFAVEHWRGGSSPSGAPAIPAPFTSLHGSEERPSFSPDGTRVAFSWFGESGDNVDIYVQAVGSNSLLRLTTDPGVDEAPSWSPDGLQIAFVRTAGDRHAIYRMSAVGGPETMVTEISRPSQKIERAAAGRPGIGFSGGVAWAPDGKSILYCESKSPEVAPSIFRFWLDTGEKRSLTSAQDEYAAGGGDAFPAVSPDGSTVAFARGYAMKREVYVMPLSGGEPRQLTFEGQVTVGLTWSADGAEIVYAKAPSLVGVLGGLWRIRSQGGDPRPVLGAGRSVRNPAISSAGRLVYERGNFDANIWLYPLRDSSGDADVEAPQRIAASTYVDHEPRISPDGNRIAFSSNRTGKFQIWSVDRDGSNLTQLTSLEGWGAGSPRWSPDGTRIAFDSNAGGNWQIYIVNAQGGLPRQLTRGEAGATRPSWSHDGEWIYFASERNGDQQIRKMSPNGGESVQVTQNGGYQPFESPDRRFVYFSKTPSDLEVWRVPVNGGSETAVPPPLNTPAWTIEENGFYFVRYAESPPGGPKWFLCLLKPGASEPVDVMEVPRQWWASGLDIAPDGTWFVYAQNDQSGSDLMLLEELK